MKPIDNPIFKRHTGRWQYALGSRVSKELREWVAICPLCRTTVTSSGGKYYRYPPIRNSRKAAKDALHVHLLLHHQ